MSSSLEQLKNSGTVVVADTGDFECMFYPFFLTLNLSTITN